MGGGGVDSVDEGSGKGGERRGGWRGRGDVLGLGGGAPLRRGDLSCWVRAWDRGRSIQSGAAVRFPFQPCGPRTLLRLHTKGALLGRFSFYKVYTKDAYRHKTTFTPSRYTHARVCPV